MYGLTKKEKLSFILEETKKNEISAYEIAKKTNLTEAGVSRILNGIVKNPHENSLNTIIEYLELKATKGDLKEKIHIINEPQQDYGKENNLTGLRDCLAENNKLTREIIKLQSLLRKNNIPFEDFFEVNN